MAPYIHLYAMCLLGILVLWGCCVLFFMFVLCGWCFVFVVVGGCGGFWLIVMVALVVVVSYLRIVVS